MTGSSTHPNRCSQGPRLDTTYIARARGVEPHNGKADPMPASHVLTPHDDGRLYVSELLDRYRDRRDALWHVVVRYTTEPGFAYVRAMPAADCERGYPTNRLISNTDHGDGP